MKTFRLLGGVSLAVLALSGAPAFSAGETIQDVPIGISTISANTLASRSGIDIEGLFVGGAGAMFNGSTGVVSANMGLGIRSLWPAIVTVEGSLGRQTSGGGDFEAWGRTSIGFEPDPSGLFDIHATAGLGLIGGTGAYQFGLGTQIKATQNVGIVLRGLARGNVGATPSDFGVEAGIRYFPFAGDQARDLERVEVLRGPQGTLYGRNPRIYGGGSVTFIPDANIAVPSVDAGALFDVGNNIDLGPRFSLGMQVPGSVFEGSGGVELGLTFDETIRAIVYGEAGIIGGSLINEVGAGAEIMFGQNVSIVGEVSMRGGWGSLTEAGFKIGGRYYFEGIDLDLGGLGDAPIVDTGGFTPYLGKSVSGIPDGGYIIPSIDFGVNFPLGSGLDAGLRGQLGYLYPVGDIEVWGGAELGYDFGSMIRGYGFVDVGSIGGFSANRLGLGGQIEVADGWSINVEGFGRGGLGSISEFGGRAGFRATLEGLSHAFGVAPPPP